MPTPSQCGRLHVLDDENTYIDRTGKWHCRRCVRERAAARRASARLEKVTALEVPYLGSELDLAYAAGMFEGEGTVTITRAGRRGYSRGVVTLTSVDRETVDFYQSRWEGAINSRDPGGNARIAWVWLLTGPGMYRFLFQVRPHLRRTLVREKFEVAMAGYLARQQGTRRDGYSEKMEEFRLQMRKLNHRGARPT